MDNVGKRCCGLATLSSTLIIKNGVRREELNTGKIHSEGQQKKLDSFLVYFYDIYSFFIITRTHFDDYMIAFIFLYEFNSSIYPFHSKLRYYRIFIL